jgi:hypothetical protein
MSRSTLFEHILSHREVLLQTDFIREIWMIPDRMIAQKADQGYVISTSSPMYPSRLYVQDGVIHALDTYTRIDNRETDVALYRIEGTSLDIPHDPDTSTPLCTPQDEFILKAGEIENYPTGPDLDTTIGIYVANYQFFVYPFGSTIPYYNDEFTSSKMEEMVSTPLRAGLISVRDVKDRYINSLYTFGQATEVICPNITEQTISIPQHIHDLRERLIEENKAALEAGDAAVMSEVEGKLIAAYKKHLEGDPSLHYLLKSKYFNVTFKKLFLVQGMTEKFGSPGQFVFIGNPLANGYRIKDLPPIFNEVRQGSHARAVETAEGGVTAKQILRVLQDVRLTIPDCGTTRGEHIHATKEQLKDLKWNYVIAADGSTVVIDDTTMNSFLGKDIVVRTPGYCEAEDGYCNKCFGKIFEELDPGAFAPIANDVGRHHITMSLKTMHGTSHSTVDISDLNKFLN